MGGRKGGDAKNMPSLRRPQPRASPVQSAEGSVPHALGSTDTFEPARSRETILLDPRKRGRSHQLWGGGCISVDASERRGMRKGIVVAIVGRYSLFH